MTAVNSFTHLVLTAFNIPIAGSPGLDPVWLEHRFKLFQEFCAPSMQAQTARNHKWIVYFDKSTPHECLARFKEITRWPQVVLALVENMDQCGKAVQENIDDGSTHLITTTLDNDDAIAHDYLSRIQGEFSGQDLLILNFPAGYRYDYVSGKAYAYRVHTNPFISLIERLDRSGAQPTTIRGCGPHNLIADRYDCIRDVPSTPGWMQVVHDRNIAATGVWGWRRVSTDGLSRQFPALKVLRAKTESGVGIYLENYRRSIERACIQMIPQTLHRSIRRYLKR